MRILFLDQSGKLGGAELNLLDLAKFYQDSCLVGLFADGLFRKSLEQSYIPVQILSSSPIEVRKDSSLFKGLASLIQIFPLVDRVIRLTHAYDLIYANTQKALIVGAIASVFSNRPLVYHLHDILSPEHFSQSNRRLAVLFANRFASLIIANSQATKTAFLEAGGKGDRVEVVYNGFHLENYRKSRDNSLEIRNKLGLSEYFTIGHFSRLSPWKSQHVLLEALTYCASCVVAIFVGDALFGEQEYVKQLHQQVAKLGLEKRVRFLGFRDDISELMTACDLVAHTSTAPEPFGRVIVESMLCERPVVATAAGGAIELIENGKTGWLTQPGNALELANTIERCRTQPKLAAEIAREAKIQASRRFDLSVIEPQINRLLNTIV